MLRPDFKGDLPQQKEDYRLGDFNELKNNPMD
jgi:hypothetical protein